MHQLRKARRFLAGMALALGLAGLATVVVPAVVPTTASPGIVQTITGAPEPAAAWISSAVRYHCTHNAYYWRTVVNERNGGVATSWRSNFGAQFASTSGLAGTYYAFTDYYPGYVIESLSYSPYSYVGTTYFTDGPDGTC